MRLTPTQAEKLIRLNAGESLPKSELPKSVLRGLQEAQAVRLEKSGSSYVVRGIPGKLTRVVEQLWGVRDLERLALATPDKRNRALLTEITGDSKALPTSPLAGIFIRTFGNCYLRDRPLGLTPVGSALLVTLSELPSLRVETKCLIGIEGVECLWKFENALRHFPHLHSMDHTLVLRWHWSTPWRKWLSKWHGPFFYFPDYDPQGINIFLTEVLSFRPDAQLLVPDHFESILDERGRRDLYLKQEKLAPTDAQHTQSAELIGIMRRLRKALEHEVFLS